MLYNDALKIKDASKEGLPFISKSSDDITATVDVSHYKSNFNLVIRLLPPVERIVY